MTIKEVCDKYCVDNKTIIELCSKGIIGHKVEKKYMFDDDDINILGEILFLKNIGLSKEEYVNFCKIDKQEKQRLLKNARQRLLEDVHQNEKKIAKIDCYLFNVK